MNGDSETSKVSSGPRWWLVLSLLVLTVIYRLVASHFDFLGNTAPMMAIAFGGALLMGARFWWVPVLLLLVSDLLLGLQHPGGGVGGYTLMSLLFYLLVARLGSRAGQREQIWPMMWFGTLTCSILFYGFANTYSWAVWEGYDKTLAGWWQSQTTGRPGIYPPSWMFLRNALIADSIWCAIAGLLFFMEKRFYPLPKEITAAAK